ncbi:unnamed protein product, partial [marine sediment metagenome]
TKYLSKIHAGRASTSWERDSSPTSNFIEATNKGDFTLSVMWLFRKRAYSISGDFIDLITTMSNSKPAPRGQVNMSGELVWEWRLMGFHTGGLPGVSGVPWSHRLSLKGIRAVLASPGYGKREVPS